MRFKSDQFDSKTIVSIVVHYDVRSKWNVGCWRHCSRFPQTPAVIVNLIGNRRDAKSNAPGRAETSVWNKNVNIQRFEVKRERHRRVSLAARSPCGNPCFGGRREPGNRNRVKTSGDGPFRNRRFRFDAGTRPRAISGGGAVCAGHVAARIIVLVNNDNCTFVLGSENDVVTRLAAQPCTAVARGNVANINRAAARTRRPTFEPKTASARRETVRDGRGTRDTRTQRFVGAKTTRPVRNRRPACSFRSATRVGVVSVARTCVRRRRRRRFTATRLVTASRFPSDRIVPARCPSQRGSERQTTRSVGFDGKLIFILPLRQIVVGPNELQGIPRNAASQVQQYLRYTSR